MGHKRAFCQTYNLSIWHTVARDATKGQCSNTVLRVISCPFSNLHDLRGPFPNASSLFASHSIAVRHLRPRHIQLHTAQGVYRETPWPFLGIAACRSAVHFGHRLDPALSGSGHRWYSDPSTVVFGNWRVLNVRKLDGGIRKLETGRLYSETTKRNTNTIHREHQLFTQLPTYVYCPPTPHPTHKFYRIRGT